MGMEVSMFQDVKMRRIEYEAQQAETLRQEALRIQATEVKQLDLDLEHGPMIKRVLEKLRDAAYPHCVVGWDTVANKGSRWVIRYYCKDRCTGCKQQYVTQVTVCIYVGSHLTFFRLTRLPDEIDTAYMNQESLVRALCRLHCTYRPAIQCSRDL